MGGQAGGEGRILQASQGGRRECSQAEALKRVLALSRPSLQSRRRVSPNPGPAGARRESRHPVAIRVAIPEPAPFTAPVATPGRDWCRAHGPMTWYFVARAWPVRRNRPSSTKWVKCRCAVRALIPRCRAYSFWVVSVLVDRKAHPTNSILDKAPSVAFATRLVAPSALR